MRGVSCCRFFRESRQEASSFGSKTIAGVESRLALNSVGLPEGAVLGDRDDVLNFFMETGMGPLSEERSRSALE